ncbi:MAG: hypothetical protein KDB80_00350 [Planctomycetes bacterium]|nr:hypothetical protein [Planctomycetota bacterium]
MQRTEILAIGTVSLLSFALPAQEPYRVAVSTTPSSFFEINSLRDHPTNHSQSYCAFATPAGGDSLFEFGWFYRIAGDAQNFAFNDDPTNMLVTPTTYDFGPPATGLNVGSMSLQWTDVDGRGFDATWQIDIAELASDRAMATHTLSLTNPTASPLTIEIFCYLDIDTDGGPGDVDERVNFNDRFVVRDQTTEHFVDVGVDPAPTAYEVDDFFADLDGRIAGGAAYDLQNTGFPFSPGDWTGAMQWSLTIDPSATTDIEVTLGRNVCPNPFGILASVSNYGTPVPGTLGPPRVSATPPIVANQFEILIGNGPSNGAATLMIGDIPQEIPYCGITLYLNPWTSLSIPLDAVGSGSVPMLTQCAPNLYGITLLAQVFTIDLGSTSPCFPIAHSDRVEMLLGD